MAQKKTSSDIYDEAADWVARRDRAPLTEAEERAFGAWLESDVRCLGAFAKTHAIMVDADRARALHTPGGVALRSSATRRRFLWAGGGLAAAASVGGLVLANYDTLFPTVLASAKGEIRRLPLVDGSSVTLDTDSSLSLHFTPRLRAMALNQGRALFEVAKDGARPFMVAVAGIDLTTDAATFAIRRDAADLVHVLVKDGAVRLQHAASGKAAVLAANSLTTTSAAGTRGRPEVATVSLAPEEIGRRLSWRQGLLSFNDQTLASAIAEFSRYGATRIILDEPSLAQETVTGLFSATDPHGFARAVAAAFHARVSEAGEEIHIYR